MLRLPSSCQQCRCAHAHCAAPPSKSLYFFQQGHGGQERGRSEHLPRSGPVPLELPHGRTLAPVEPALALPLGVARPVAAPLDGQCLLRPVLLPGRPQPELPHIQGGKQLAVLPRLYSQRPRPRPGVWSLGSRRGWRDSGAARRGRWPRYLGSPAWWRCPRPVQRDRSSPADSGASELRTLQARIAPQPAGRRPLLPLRCRGSRGSRAAGAAV